MSPTIRPFVRSLAPLALMAVIFVLSAQPNLGTDLGVIDLIGRKIAHAGVYALLTLLWWWALGGDTTAAGGKRGRRTLIAAATVSLLYAASDEFHQAFVDGRVGSPVDVGIDAIGIAVACWLVLSGHAGRWVRRLTSRLQSGRRRRSGNEE